MTIKTNKLSLWLALVLSCLIALPPPVLADSTELFTTSANPNVLLMLDVSGSMNDAAGGSSVGNLDGTGNTNSRMDSLWKVVYTLLNADLSIPASSTTYTCRTGARIRTRDNPYSRIEVDGSNWSRFPATNGTIQIGSGGSSETVTYSSKSTSSGNYYFNFSPSVNFRNSYSINTTVSLSASSLYSYPYPTSHAEATNTDFQNNLTQADEETLKARLGLLTFTGSLPSSYNINIRNQIAPGAPNAPPFSPSYQNIWSSVKSYAYPSSYTPTAKALNSAQTFFSTAYNASMVCRPNFAVLITDGEDTMGGTDGATGGTANYYSGSNFWSDGCSSWSGGSCVSGRGQGQVGRHNAVISQSANLLAFNPNVKLFTVGVGISGSDADLRVQREVLRRAAEQQNAQGTIAEFNTIGGSGDNTSRGAGRAFFATDANELSVALRNIFYQIASGSYSFSAPTVASVRLTDKNYLYKARFIPNTPPSTLWEGHLEALTINTDNTYTFVWDAATVLQNTDPAARRIFAGYTDNTSWSRRDFTTSGSNITSAMLGVSNDAERLAVINYVRGVGHDNNAKLGDIFHSKPVVVGPPSRFFLDEGYSTAVGASQSFVDAKATRKRVIYAGTNDGMLHAFLSGTYDTGTGRYDSGTGEELFGFIPYSLLDVIQDFVPGDLTSHGYYVDSSPRAADVWIDANNDGTKQSSEWRTVLIGGLRKGGSSYYALDVTDPPTGTDYSNYPKVLWEYSDDVNVGETWSEPYIGKIRMQDTGWSTARDRWVAIFGGGKTSAGTIGTSLVVLDIATGTALKTFTTGIGQPIAASSSVVLDANGYIKFAYAVDFSGGVYKFDFRTTGLRSNGFSAWDMKKIFQASAGQPAYLRVEPASISESSRYLFFGTGNQEFPVSDGGTGKLYAIIDTDSFWPSSPLVETNLANLTSNLATGTAAPTQYGWFVNLLNIPSAANATDSYTHAGEKVLSDPVIFNNNVFFTTFTPNVANPCAGGGIARVYGLNTQNAKPGLAALSSLGETPGTKVPYHVYAGAQGGIPSSPSLSINPNGQSSVFVGFSTGTITEILIESPTNMKQIKSWKETF